MRVASGILALTYGLAFVAVCLGGCLAPASAGAHDCCSEEAGLHAPAADCCTVVSAVSAATLTTAPPPSVIVAHAPSPADLVRPLARHESHPLLSPSPPLILRI